MHGKFRDNSLLNITCHVKLNKQYGVLLIEYMLAISIGLSLILFIFEVYRGMRTSHQFIQSVYTAFTEAEAVIRLINQEIHAAGRMGCEKINEQHLVYDNVQHKFRRFYPLILDKNSIRVTHTDTDYALLLHDATHAYTIYASNSLSLRAGDWVVLSDCIHTELNRIVNVYHKTQHEQRIELAQPLYFSFKKDAMLSKFTTVDIVFTRNHAKHTVSVVVNGHRTPVSEYVDNLSFYYATPHSVRYEFDVVLQGVRKIWYGYAALQ